MTANTTPINNSKIKKKETTYEYVISKTTSNLTQLAGGIKRLSAAVFIAARYEGTGEARKLVPRSPEQLDKLKRIVQSALGLQGNGDNITLEEIPFHDTFGSALQNLDADDKRQFWFNQVQNLVYLLLALGMVGLFWWTLKRTPVESVTAPAPAWEGVSGGNERGALPGAPPGSPRVASPAPGAPMRGGAGAPLENVPGQTLPGQTEPSLTPGVVSAEVLNRLVQENPDNFSQAIHAWLARGDLN